MPPKNFVTFQQFSLVVDWALQVRDDQHPGVKFLLTGVRFEQPTNWSEHFGERIRPTDAFNALGHALAKSLRRSDLVCRDGVVFWALSLAADEAALAERVRRSISRHGAAPLTSLGCDIRVFQLPFVEASDDSAQHLLEHLRLTRLTALPALQAASYQTSNNNSKE